MIEKKHNFQLTHHYGFTDDSNLLLVGDQIRFLYCFDDEFNEIYNQ